MTDTSNLPGLLPARIEAARLDPGLYLVATPIGTARDITLRALDVLNSADLLAAEDTRTLRHLLGIHGVPLRNRRIIPCHDHNEARQSTALIAAFEQGKSVAYCSDAGTPLVADPGFRLAREAIRHGAKIHVVPGPSAVLAALSVAGLPSDRFLFAGFAPQPAAARKTWLADITAVNATTIIFDSPKRVKQTLEMLCEIDPERVIVLCRELTKKFEETIHGKPREIIAHIPESGIKGEIILVLDRPVIAPSETGDIKAALADLLADMSVRDAAAVVAEKFKISRRDAYQYALSIEKDN